MEIHLQLFSATLLKEKLQTNHDEHTYPY